MAYVRRHWFASVLYISIIALGFAVWLTPLMFSEGTPQAAQAQEAEPQPIDPYLYTRVQKLRDELALTNRDLAAMGYTEESATLLLEGLKSWAVTNKAILDHQHRDAIKARASLRETIRLINTGSQLADALPELQKELAKIEENRKGVHDGLIAQIENSMDAYQLQRWQSARANLGLPFQFRYVPGLTDQQRQDFHRRLTVRGAQDIRGDTLAAELTYSQKQALDSSRLNITTKVKGVRNAVESALPVPAIFSENYVVPNIDEPRF